MLTQRNVMRRLPSLAIAAITLTATAGALPARASAVSYPKISAISSFAKPFSLGGTNDSATRVAVGADGVAHVATRVSSTAIQVCTIPIGKRACKSNVTLAPQPGGSFGDEPQIVVTDAGLLDVLTTETSANTADEFPLVMWVSHDNGGSFGPATEVAATDGNDPIYPTGAVAADGSNLVLLDDEGGRERVLPADGSALAAAPQPLETSEQTSSGGDTAAVEDRDGPKVVVAFDGTVYSAHTRIDQGGGQEDTTYVYSQPSAGGPVTTVATLPGEYLRSLTTSRAGGTYLMTRSTDSDNSNSDRVLVRKVSATMLGAGHSVPRGEPYDTDGYRLAEDGQGLLHAFWLGGIYDRAFTATSSDGGKSWTVSALGASGLRGFASLAIAPAGFGLAIESASGLTNVLVQPILITPAVHLRQGISKSKVDYAVRLVGSVQPALGGHVVDLYDVTNHHHVKVASTREDSHGAFAFDLAERSAGERSFNVFVDGIAGKYDVATSRTVGVNVKQES